MTDQEAVPVPPAEDPMWESDIAEREAKRRKMIYFGGSAAAVLVGFVLLYAALSWLAGGLTSDPANPEGVALGGGGSVVTNPDQGAAPPAVSAVPAQIEAADDLDWFAIESPIGFAQRLFADQTGTFYALSTVPGLVNTWPVPKAIYKSTDGETWDIINLDETVSANDMAMRSGSIYLIGTAPGNRNFDEPAEIVISASADEGASWTQSILPTVAAPPGGAPIEWTDMRMQIAATDGAILAAVQSNFFLDYRRMVPAEFVGDNYGYTPTSDGTGVAVVDYRLLDQAYVACEGEMNRNDGDTTDMSEDCEALFNGDESVGAIGIVTWEEMGLEDGSQPMFSEMFVSVDGESFEAVESPVGPGAEMQQLFGSPGGFAVIEFDRAGQSIWTSPDGRSWESDAALGQFDWVSNVGTVNGEMVVAGQSRNGSIVAWQNDSGSWEIVNFDSVLGGVGADNRWISSAGIGPLGVVAVFQTNDELSERDSTEVVLGTSPEIWSPIPIEEITGLAGGYSNWVVVGTDTVLIRYEVYNLARPLSLQVVGVAAT